VGVRKWDSRESVYQKAFRGGRCKGAGVMDDAESADWYKTRMCRQSNGRLSSPVVNPGAR